MHYSYLALGDSYTIGEQVLLAQSFPYQTVQLLRKKGLNFYAPEIIATTGHTTDELENAINGTLTLPEYDIVSLLIGVNNQYRGRSAEDFEPAFEKLLQQAIHYANNKAKHVFVLSIPDWGITPFAAERNTQQIATEIDTYNLVCKAMATKYGANFIDITTGQRADGNKEGFLASDQLHPGEKEYTKWAELLCQQIVEQIE
jgi:lysophospholipase L1-like esterase